MSSREIETSSTTSSTVPVSPTQRRPSAGSITEIATRPSRHDRATPFARPTSTLPRGLVERLHGLAQREGATLFMALLSGFALLLARYSGQQDLLIGTPVANRNRSLASRVLTLDAGRLPRLLLLRLLLQRNTKPYWRLG